MHNKIKKISKKNNPWYRLSKYQRQLLKNQSISTLCKNEMQVFGLDCCIGSAGKETISPITWICISFSSSVIRQRSLCTTFHSSPLSELNSAAVAVGDGNSEKMFGENRRLILKRWSFLTAVSIAHTQKTSVACSEWHEETSRRAAPLPL